MRVHRLAVIVAIFIGAATMGGCAQSPAIAPVVMDVGALSGKTVDLVEGKTEVVLSNSDGGIQDVTFTVDVTAH